MKQSFFHMSQNHYFPMKNQKCIKWMCKVQGYIFRLHKAVSNCHTHQKLWYMTLFFTISKCRNLIQICSLLELQNPRECAIFPYFRVLIDWVRHKRKSYYAFHMYRTSAHFKTLKIVNGLKFQNFRLKNFRSFKNKFYQHIFFSSFGYERCLAHHKS